MGRGWNTPLPFVGRSFRSSGPCPALLCRDEELDQIAQVLLGEQLAESFGHPAEPLPAFLEVALLMTWHVVPF